MFSFLIQLGEGRYTLVTVQKIMASKFNKHITSIRAVLIKRSNKEKLTLISTTYC